MRTISERKRQRITGRRSGPPFLKLLHNIIDSPEFAELSGAAIKLLLDLARQFNGMNNGNFDTSQLQMKWNKEGTPARSNTCGLKPARLPGKRWNSERKLTRATRELIENGWIVRTKQGGFGIGCSLYAITWWPVDECPGRQLDFPAENVASNLWDKKTPHSKRVLDAPETGAGPTKKCAGIERIAPETGAKTTISETA